MLQDDLPEDDKESAAVMKRITHVCMDRPIPAGSQDKAKDVMDRGRESAEGAVRGGAGGLRPGGNSVNSRSKD